MEQYQFFTVEEFIQDKCFRSWVLGQHPETEHFWLHFQQLHPERKTTLLTARALLISLHELQAIPTDAQGRRMWAIINESTAYGADIGRQQETQKGTLRPIGRWLSVAAVLLAALGLGWFVFQNNNKKLAFRAEQAAESTLPAIERKNATALPQYILLSDGSRLILYPGSQVSYASSFEAATREVILSGKGYFEVIADETKPFIVYANGLVTKVVGTSFTVDAFVESTSPKVEVHTGKVKVFTLERFRAAQWGQPEEMVLLTANQQTSYDATKKNFTTSPIPIPNTTNAQGTRRDFNFQNVAVAHVFKTLEESYGVTIEYNRKDLKNCNITAPLDSEPLFRQLDIVCQTIGVTYEVFETRIVVSGPGCDL